MDSFTTYANLKIGSWNCRGHSDNRIEYMSKLMDEVDILFVQEHWLYENNIASLVNTMTDIQVYGISSMDPGVLLNGRPFGGCAFFI